MSYPQIKKDYWQANRDVIRITVHRKKGVAYFDFRSCGDLENINNYELEKRLQSGHKIQLTGFNNRGVIMDKQKLQNLIKKRTNIENFEGII